MVLCERWRCIQALYGVFQGSFAQAMDKSAAPSALCFAACVNTDDVVTSMEVTAVLMQ